MRRYWDIVITGLGVIFVLFGCYLVWERRAPIDRVHATSQLGEGTVAIYPTRLEIPARNINLPIFLSNIHDGEWETTREGVSYLMTTPNPGEKGNSVIYGHNWPNILGNLKSVIPGDKIIIYKGETRITYTVHYTMTVTPDQTHITTNTEDARVTIYTCTGFLDSKRFVVVAVIDER